MKKSSGCMECIRYSLVLLHTFFLVLGLLVVFLGVWLYAANANQNLMAISTADLTTSRLHKSCFLLIATGCFLSVLSIAGCLGSITNSRCILIFVMLSMVVLVIVELALGVLGFLFQDQITQHLTVELSDSLVHFAGDNETDPVSMGWTQIQTYFSCCGVDTDAGYMNHTNVNGTGSLWYRTQGQKAGEEYPLSCCDEDDGCYTQVDGDLPESLNQQGCLVAVTRFFSTHLYLISLLAIFLIVLQITTSVLSYNLYHSTGKTGYK